MRNFQINSRVKTNRDFYQLPLGAVGTIIEDYNTGFMVKWDNYDFTDGFDKETELDFLELIND